MKGPNEELNQELQKQKVIETLKSLEDEFDGLYAGAEVIYKEDMESLKLKDQQFLEETMKEESFIQAEKEMLTANDLEKAKEKADNLASKESFFKGVGKRGVRHENYKNRKDIPAKVSAVLKDNEECDAIARKEYDSYVEKIREKKGAYSGDGRKDPAVLTHLTAIARMEPELAPQMMEPKQMLLALGAVKEDVAKVNASPEEIEEDKQKNYELRTEKARAIECVMDNIMSWDPVDFEFDKMEDLAKSVKLPVILEKLAVCGECDRMMTTYEKFIKQGTANCKYDKESFIKIKARQKTYEGLCSDLNMLLRVMKNPYYARFLDSDFEKQNPGELGMVTNDGRGKYAELISKHGMSSDSLMQENAFLHYVINMDKYLQTKAMKQDRDYTGGSIIKTFQVNEAQIRSEWK